MTGSVPGRLVVRRIPELNPKGTEGQPTLFESYRFHSFFTTIDAATLDAVAADKVQRKHARIEQVNADLKDCALAHLPSGKFAANSAWLVTDVMAYNLTRTAGILAEGQFAKARTGTIRRKIINVPARIASSARRQQFHLPDSWPWQSERANLFTATHAPPQTAQKPSTQPTPAQPKEPKSGTPTAPRPAQKHQMTKNWGSVNPQTGSVDQG